VVAVVVQPTQLVHVWQVVAVLVQSAVGNFVTGRLQVQSGRGGFGGVGVATSITGSSVYDGGGDRGGTYGNN
jgi:hypothetical protein